MNTVEAYRAVDALADWGVLQLAIGGGEPFLRPDLSYIMGTVPLI